jgi:3',5'-cyclic AMP phosphodiesterase CpdA
VDLTTVADDLVVFHDAPQVHRFEGLEPDREYELLGQRVRTLARPPGELLTTFATVNDVHFGEVECGRIDDLEEGPIQRVAPGEPPHPETMNRGAVGEIAATDVAAVIVKGDLSNDGADDEWDAFERCYRDRFGARLHVVRGNHDAYRGQEKYTGDAWIELPGVAVALLDTTIPTRTSGRVLPEQLEWLDAHVAHADRPVIVMGHHQQWIPTRPGGPLEQGPDAPRPGSPERPPDYFGINPDDSDALAELIARRPAIVAYTAGHTHRHRVRPIPQAGGVPSIEVGCVKDFPGTWAEHRVYEGGVLHVVHRVSTPAALSWSERCRHLYSDFGVDYENYALGRLEDRCFPIALRHLAA